MASFTDRGILFVLSAPSGTEKSVITKRLLALNPQIFLSISVTTRLPRTHEVDTSDYCFVSEHDFDEMIERDGFLEWAKPLRGPALTHSELDCPQSVNNRPVKLFADSCRISISPSPA